VIIGFYVGARFLRTLARENATLAPYLTPVVILLSVVAFSTWVINPIGNLFLRFNRYGQFLLDKKEKMSSNFVAISLAVCIVGLLSYFILSDDKFLTVAAFGFAMMVPLGSMFSSTKYKNALIIYTIAMAAVGILGISTTFSTGEIFNPFIPIFIFGFVAFQWVANYMIIQSGNK
jgi:hypothetical protein